MRGRARTLRAGLAATLLLVLLAGIAWWFVVAAWKPSPPRTLRMATGPAGSASADIGARYRDRLPPPGAGRGARIRADGHHDGRGVSGARLARDCLLRAAVALRARSGHEGGVRCVSGP